MLNKTMAGWMAALGMGLLASGAARAQQAAFEPSPDCLISAGYAAPRFDHYPPGFLWRDGDFSIEGAILTWYIGGPQAIILADDFNLRLWEDCFDPKSSVTCPGIRKDKKIARAFVRPFGKLTKGDKKAIEKYFSQPVPDEAIRFAAQGLGRCFGNHPAQGTMEELGFRRGPFDAATCKAALATYSGVPGSATDSRVRGAPTFSSWGHTFDEHTAGGSCAFAPEVALANAQLKAAEDAARQAQRENRPVEERIAGLNGCQIAYGLVTMGLSGKPGSGVARVPDEGIGWALRYETSVIENEACPIMSKSLSDWVQAQPLTRFEVAEDPYAGFVRRKPGRNDLESWTQYVATVARHYETAQAPQIDLSGELCPDFHAWLAQKHYAGNGGDDPLANFLYRQAVDLDYSLRPALCVAVPKWLYARYANDRALAASRRAAADAKLARREAFMNSIEELGRQKFKPAYRPPAGEPRCYRTGEKVETCFYN